MTITRDLVLAALTRHIGRAKGVRVQELVYEITGETLRSEGAERKVREIVSDLRESGIAICAYPGDGYYIAGTSEELEQCCAFLRSRAMHSLVLESRLRKIPLPELLGQLRLNT
jgi:hypothetical protein